MGSVMSSWQSSIPATQDSASLMPGLLDSRLYPQFLHIISIKGILSRHAGSWQDAWTIHARSRRGGKEEAEGEEDEDEEIKPSPSPSPSRIDVPEKAS